MKNMKAILTRLRISVGLTGLAVSAVLAAVTCGFVPNESVARLEGRRYFCESLAITFSVVAPQSDLATLKSTLAVMAARHPDVRSIGIRQSSGQLLLSSGPHADTLKSMDSGRSTDSDIHVPIMAGNEQWGDLEISFKPLYPTNVREWCLQPFVLLLTCVSTFCLATFFIYLRYVLRYLDPSKAVPSRVRDALNSLAGGLMVLNTKGEIVLSNNAFASTIGVKPEELMGKVAENLPWQSGDSACGEAGDSAEARFEVPWKRVADDGLTRTGVVLKLALTGMDERTFMVSAVPIRDEKNKCQGVLTSLEDITSLERKKTELSLALTVLRESNQTISKQNRELERLATRDALTGCFNRRAFFEQFSTHWNNAERYHHPLSTIMVDIDHFKSINDRFGHSVGDQVLQKVATALIETARQGDLVCRYGGEEFAVLLTHTDLPSAVLAAERFRLAIEQLPFPNLSVTTSVGVSEMAMGAASMQELLDQADKCLYVAKRNGRNRVVSWDTVPPDMEVDPKAVSRTRPVTDSAPPVSIPYPAVTALISALCYRDVRTAEHSRRVADLCVMAAEGQMSMTDCYVLEIGALLHDIGKIGVPDNVLLKPAALTREEWQIMERHDRIGIEIIRASFNSPQLSQIVENHHAFFGIGARHEGLPTGADIPISARLLSIADAYDAMVSDRVYRKGRAPAEAFIELRRCAGSQFDPKLVEHFIEVMTIRLMQEHATTCSVSKDAALNFGLQMERIASAVDHQDMEGLKTLASRLDEIATSCNATEIATKARQLEQLVGNADLIAILKSANELQNVCRETQKSYLHHSTA
jgi:diguanylate cyclase (GGDEF)-like protein/putative nucleotidyltransferase with HDIG domain